MIFKENNQWHIQNLKKYQLKKHPELNEKWVQDRIAEDPKILGLGDVILKDRKESNHMLGD